MKYLLSLFPLLISFIGFSQDPRIPYLKNGQWGFADSTGQVVVEPKYVSVNYFDDEGAALVTVNTDRGYKRGLINKAGEILLEPIYDYCESLGDDFYVVSKSASKALFKADQSITKFDFKSIAKVEGKNLFKVEAEHNESGFAKYWGVMRVEADSNYLIIPHKYSMINYDSEKKVFYAITVRHPKNTVAYYDENGYGLPADGFEKGPQVEEEVATQDETTYEEIERGNKIRNKSVVLMNATFDEWNNNYDQVVAFGAYDRFIVKKNEKFGLSTSKGELLLDVAYDMITQMRPESRYIFVQQGDQKGAIDARTMEYVFPMGAYNFKGRSIFVEGFEVFGILTNKSYGGSREVFISPSGTTFFEFEEE